MQQFILVFAIAAVAAVVLATLAGSVIARLGFPLPSEDRRIGCVDGLRGYLALAVLLHHFFIWVQTTQPGGEWAPPSTHFLNQLGTGSVGLFFMATGLVFYPKVLSGFRSTDWLPIYVTRVFRILPLVIFAVGIITVIIIARTGKTPDAGYIGSAARWISAWRQVPLLGYPDSGRLNAYVLWSLWYEWLFYFLVLPASAWAMDLARSRGLPTWAVPVGLLGVGIAARVFGKVFQLPTSILYYLPLFASGMLAFEAQSRPRIRATLSSPQVAIPSVMGLLLGMTATSNPYSLSLPLFAFFFVCVACGNDLGGLFRTRGALVLGECSFGIYILHGIVLDVLFVDTGALNRLNLSELPLLLLMAALVVVPLTAATYLLVERTALSSGKSLSHWLAGRRVRLDPQESEVAP